jgi:hypothetical protein
VGKFRYVEAIPEGDIDLLLIVAEDFDSEQVSDAARTVFDAGRAKLAFNSDVFWARVSIGEKALLAWLETYQIDRNFP